MKSTALRGAFLRTESHTKKAALKGQLLCCFHFRSEDQPSEIAPTGQVPAQDPQSMQASASMLYWVSPWEIAPTGQPSAQEPQEMQESEILYAIIFTSLMVLLYTAKRILQHVNFVSQEQQPVKLWIKYKKSLRKSKSVWYDDRFSIRRKCGIILH